MSAERTSIVDELKDKYAPCREFIAALRQAEVALLGRYCNMGYADRCRPDWCEYRMTGTCSFWPEFGKLQAELAAAGVPIESTFRVWPSRVLGDPTDADQPPEQGAQAPPKADSGCS